VSPEEFTFESEYQRLAGILEVTHLVHLASRDWQQLWNGKFGSSLKEPSTNAMFFHDFIFQTSSTTTVLTYALTCLPPLIMIYRRRRLYRGKQPWPFHLIMKCEITEDEKEQLRKFRPRSD
jgi:hypothetical protein